MKLIPIPYEFFVGYHHALGGIGKRQFADGSFPTPSAKPSALPLPPGDTKFSIVIGITHVLLLGGLALLPAGCHRPRTDGAPAVKTVVVGGREFPDFLVGRWVADRHGWEFVLERAGRISSAVISLGRVRVTPGQTTTVPTRSGSEAVFTPGSWLVHYEPDTRTLTVKIVMDHVRVEMAGNILEGSSTDVFAGPVSPAGDTWQTEWTTFTRYTAHTPESTSFDMSTDPVYGETKPLIFQKATDPRR